MITLTLTTRGKGQLCFSVLLCDATSRFPKFVLLHNNQEAVVDFQASAYPGLHFEFQSQLDPPHHHLFVYSQVIFENRTCIDFTVSERGLGGAIQASLSANQRFSTSIAAAENLEIKVGENSVPADLRSLPVHTHSNLGCDTVQSSAFGCIQHSVSKLFVYPEGGRRLVLKPMINDNQEGYVFRLCRH